MDSYANGYNYYNNYGSSVDSTAVGGILGIVFAIIGIILLIAAVIAVFQIVGQWKMFKKANQPGWAALVPIYNTYILCKVVGVSPWWIVVVFASSLLSFIPIVGSLLVMAVSIYFSIMIVGSTAKSYGKDTGWAIGLFFLAPFFTFALGVGKSEYVGPSPIGDPIMDKFTANKQNNPSVQQPTNQTSSNVSFCPNCGTKLDGDTKFCPSCGKQI